MAADIGELASEADLRRKPMTEAEWFACSNTQSMLDFLSGNEEVDRVVQIARGLGGKDHEDVVKDLLEATNFMRSLPARASERKLRLFAVACCRQIERLFSRPLERNTVEILEGIADGRLAQIERTKALRSLTRTINREWGGVHVDNPASYPMMTVWAAAQRFGSSAWYTAGVAARALVHQRAAMGHQAELLRCIIGNPFHPIAISSSAVTRRNRTVVKLAQAIYEERELPSGQLDAGRLAILADALEDAGCQDADILSHLRGPGPHVRGCWVVDLLLGRE